MKNKLQILFLAGVSFLVFSCSSTEPTPPASTDLAGDESPPAVEVVPTINAPTAKYVKYETISEEELPKSFACCLEAYFPNK